MQKKVIFYIILICVLTLPGIARAIGPTFWFNIGPGFGTVDKGSTISASFSYQMGNHVITARAVGTGAAMLSKGKNMHDYAILYNRAFISSRLHLCAGAGIAVVGGSYDPDGLNLFSESNTKKIDSTIGLPMDIQLFLRPLRFMGIGLYGFANLNPEESFAGVTLCLQFGKLR